MLLDSCGVDTGEFVTLGLTWVALPQPLTNGAITRRPRLSQVTNVLVTFTSMPLSSLYIKRTKPPTTRRGWLGSDSVLDFATC
jgi:hypothetical protein